MERGQVQVRMAAARTAGWVLRVSALLVAATLVACAQTAESSIVDLKPQDADLWEHRLGPETAVHLSAEEFRALRPGMESVELEIVVSANGRVESAQVTGDIRVHSDEARAIEMERLFSPWVINGAPTSVRVTDYVSILPPEEWASVHIPFPQPWHLEGASVQLARTLCYGTCPDYRLTIAGDGTVRFSGHSNVLIPGDHVAHIAASAVRSLIEDFQKADFFSAKDSYQAYWTDNPTQTLTLTLDGHTKKVVDYVGIEAGLPLGIRNLEAEVDETADAARWIKGDELTLPSLEAERWPFGAVMSQNLVLYDAALTAANSALVDRFVAARAPIVAPWATVSDLGTDGERISSPVCVASGKGDLDLVERLIQSASAGPSRKPTSLPQRVLNECLLTGARSGDLDVVAYWLDHGADPKATPTDHQIMQGWGALANAVESGNAEMVRLLIDHDVDVHAPVNAGDGQPLLVFALERAPKEKVAIELLLIKAGANVNGRDSMGQTPIFAVGSVPEAVTPLLEAGADINARDHNGGTALMRNAYIEQTVRELLTDGADPTPTNIRGDTALTTARQMSCPSCAELIEESLKKRVHSAVSSSNGR
jgi:ankyrin repeat protein